MQLICNIWLGLHEGFWWRWRMRKAASEPKRKQHVSSWPWCSIYASNFTETKLKTVIREKSRVIKVRFIHKNDNKKKKKKKILGDGRVQNWEHASLGWLGKGWTNSQLCLFCVCCFFNLSTVSIILMCLSILTCHSLIWLFFVYLALCVQFNLPGSYPLPNFKFNLWFR